MKVKFNILSIPFLYIGLLLLLDAFYKDYYGHDTFELTLISSSIIFFIILITVLLIVLWLSEEKDNFIKIAKSFAYGVFFGFAILFYIIMVKNDTIFYLNKSYAKEVFNEPFYVNYKNTSSRNNTVHIRSVFNDYDFTVRDKFIDSDFSRLKEGDIIVIKMAKGLLNEPFLFSGNIEIIE